jgi:hypothetical protein
VIGADKVKGCEFCEEMQLKMEENGPCTFSLDIAQKTLIFAVTPVLYLCM